MAKKRIIMLENDERVQYAFTKVLEHEGCECLAASAKDNKCDCLSEKKPDALFIDISCPHKEIKDIIKKMETGELGTPVFVLTSHLTDELKQWCIKHNAMGILEKPVSIHALREILKMLDAKTML
ncbi:MAG: response regulator [Calditrichaeota bacterium]|nr:response regulator [Calditrichota bacterium]